MMKFMFLGFWAFDSVYAMDSLLSPKGVNYEGNVHFQDKINSEKMFLTFFFVSSCSRCVNVSEEQDERSNRGFVWLGHKLC